MSHYQDYIDAGFRIFGLHSIVNGVCACGDPECEAVGKHPRMSNWQNAPHWSDDQIEVMEEAGHFDTGFGVNVQGFIIIDIDARNGGVESFSKLCEAHKIDYLGESGFAVETGSGGGSMHLYFKAPEGVSLVQHVKDYEGIDFKSTGFVVGNGSLHASGMCYESLHGFPDKITDAPAALIELLRRPERHRTILSGNIMDISDKDIADQLSYIDPDCDYEQWIRIGMAIHDATNGAGIDLFDEWSKNGKKYTGFNSLEKHWHSFGKSGNPVGIGTLIYYAQQGGYQRDATFIPTVDYTAETAKTDLCPSSEIDLLRPPGFVGELTQWVNSQCRFKRENLAVAVALNAVSNIAGMRLEDTLLGTRCNLLTFCVAGSATGKEAIQQAYTRIMQASGMLPAVYGSIKSEQEIYRNLLRHQAAFYNIGELGLQLKKIVESKNDYYKGAVASLMDIYTKADGILTISGDMKDAVEQELRKELASIQKVMELKGETDLLVRKEQSIQARIESIHAGIVEPYLSVIGYTTPATFDGLMTPQEGESGFIGRSMIFEEKEFHPRIKKGHKIPPMDERLTQTLKTLRRPGYFDSMDDGRIEHAGQRTSIPTTPEAEKRLLDDVETYFYQKGQDLSGAPALVPVVRRALELVSKVSLVLAAPSGLRTLEHVEWAFALVDRDVKKKIMLIRSNDEHEGLDAVAATILNQLDYETEVSEGLLLKQCRRRKFADNDVVSTLDAMIEKGLIIKSVSQHPKNKKEICKYLLHEDAKKL